jgi:hypothetical protein
MTRKEAFRAKVQESMKGLSPEETASWAWLLELLDRKPD